MKLITDERLNKLANEYCLLGISMGYFSKYQSNIFFKKLQNLDVIFSDDLPGDSFINVEKNQLWINSKRVFVNSEFASLTMFHEFTHACSSVYADIHNENGYFKKLRDNVDKIVPDTRYDYHKQTYSAGDIFNPFTYIKYGGLLIDEVTAEYIATRMMCIKFNKPFPEYNPKIGRKYLEPSNISYYASGQNLVNSFAKTLFLPSSDKNINGLCKKIFDKNFVRDLFRQHCEPDKAVNPLIYLCRELGLMGVIAWYEEQQNNRCEGTPIPDDFAYHCYCSCQDELSQGFEPRQNIPYSLSLPSYLEDIDE